jgi:hypothetical protein
MSRLALLLASFALAITCAASDTVTFDHVKIHRHRSAEKRALVDKVGALTFDDTNRKFTFEKNREDRFDEPEIVVVGYDSVTKIVFDVTAHMRGGGIAQAIQAAPFGGGIVGAVIAGQHVHDYWFYIEYKNADQNERLLLEVPKDSSQKVIAKASSLFGSRVSVSDFPENDEEIDLQKLPAFKSKQSMKIDKKNRPVPEAKLDKATIVVVCPPLAARYSGKGNQYKLHANERVIAVNREGTYGFAYVDPGKYRLASQAENANGFEMELDAGKTYYFLQNTFQGVFRARTTLSRNSPELVGYLMEGTYFSDWTLK